MRTEGCSAACSSEVFYFKPSQTIPSPPALSSNEEFMPGLPPRQERTGSPRRPVGVEDGAVGYPKPRYRAHSLPTCSSCRRLGPGQQLHIPAGSPHRTTPRPAPAPSSNICWGFLTDLLISKGKEQGRIGWSSSPHSHCSLTHHRANDAFVHVSEEAQTRRTRPCQVLFLWKLVVRWF